MVLCFQARGRGDNWSECLWHKRSSWLQVPTRKHCHKSWRIWGTYFCHQSFYERQARVFIVCHLLQTFTLKPFSQSEPNFMCTHQRSGELKVHTDIYNAWSEMAVRVNNLPKNLQNHWCDDAGSLQAACRTELRSQTWYKYIHETFCSDSDTLSCISHSNSMKNVRNSVHFECKFTCSHVTSLISLGWLEPNFYHWSEVVMGMKICSNVPTSWLTTDARADNSIYAYIIMWSKSQERLVCLGNKVLSTF